MCPIFTSRRFSDRIKPHEIPLGEALAMRYDFPNPPRVVALLVLLAAAVAPVRTRGDQYMMQSYPVPAGSFPHDVAPAVDGGVWYTAHNAAALGWLDPATGQTHHIPLGAGSRPHGVIVGPDGAPWITDDGLNAIVRVDPLTETVTPFPLPANRPNASPHTATFDLSGRLWFTGINGVYGVLVPSTGQMDVYSAPEGAGPYGITTTPGGDVYYASLAGDYVARINLETGAAMVLEPPTANQGARRVWSDSQGRIWVSEWDAGQVGRYEPTTGQWREWPLPGPAPRPYAVYVDEQDIVWLSDFGANALVRFDPVTEEFDPFPLPSSQGEVRQILGRDGEVWGAESRTDRLVVLRRIEEAVAGDFNNDGVVDGADLLNWQAGFGTSGAATHSQGDADGDADVDGADFLAWQRELGRGAIGTAASASVPEPTALLAMEAAAAFVLYQRRARKRWYF